jgi:hypothetical protein
MLRRLIRVAPSGGALSGPHPPLGPAPGPRYAAGRPPERSPSPPVLPSLAAPAGCTQLSRNASSEGIDLSSNTSCSSETRVSRHERGDRGPQSQLARAHTTGGGERPRPPLRSGGEAPRLAPLRNPTASNRRRRRWPGLPPGWASVSTLSDSESRSARAPFSSCRDRAAEPAGTRAGPSPGLQVARWRSESPDSESRDSSPHGGLGPRVRVGTGRIRPVLSGLPLGGEGSDGSHGPAGPAD